MSFREKNAWIASITTILVWGYYFFEVWRAFEMRSVDGLLTRFWVCMGITIVVMIALNLIATRNRLSDFGAPPDELEVECGAGPLRQFEGLPGDVNAVPHVARIEARFPEERQIGLLNLVGHLPASPLQRRFAA